MFGLKEARVRHRLRTLLLASAVGLTLPVAALAGSWQGPHAGAYGAYASGGTFGLGAKFGYDFDLGNSVHAGPEADLPHMPATGTSVGKVSARPGYAVTPDLAG